MNTKPETLEKFRKVQHLLKTEKIDGDPITLKAACKRVDLSLVWFYKLRKIGAVDLGFQVEERSGPLALAFEE